MTPGAVYALLAVLLGFGGVLDTLITRYGISKGFVEANPVYKILPQKAQDFIFKTAFGSFLDGGLKLFLAAFIATVFYNLGYGHENGSYYDSLILGIPAVGVYALNVRNLLLLKNAGKAKVTAVKK